MLKTDDVLFNYHRDCDEKIGKLYVLRGNKTEEVKELHAGDIGALAKLSLSQTTDSLSVRNNPVAYLRTNFSKPYVSMRYKAKTKGMWIRFPSRCKNSDGRSDAACGK